MTKHLTTAVFSAWSQGDEWILAGVCKDEADGRGRVCAPWSFPRILVITF